MWYLRVCLPNGLRSLELECLAFSFLLSTLCVSTLSEFLIHCSLPCSFMHGLIMTVNVFVCIKITYADYSQSKLHSYNSPLRYGNVIGLARAW